MIDIEECMVADIKVGPHPLSHFGKLPLPLPKPAPLTTLKTGKTQFDSMSRYVEQQSI
jgi:hypothetical protein